MNESESQSQDPSAAKNSRAAESASNTLLNLPDPGDTDGIRVNDVIAIFEILLGSSERHLAIVTTFGVRFAPCSLANSIALSRLGLLSRKCISLSEANAQNADAYFKIHAAAVREAQEVAEKAGKDLRQLERLGVMLVSASNRQWLLIVHAGEFVYFEGTCDSVSLLADQYHINVADKTRLDTSFHPNPE